MTDQMDFAGLLPAANESNAKAGCNPGQWTPETCKISREVEPEMSRLLEAAIAWELTSRRRAQPEEEAEVREVRRMMDEATAAARAAKADV
jgi:hypothetical protein